MYTAILKIFRHLKNVQLLNFFYLKTILKNSTNKKKGDKEEIIKQTLMLLKKKYILYIYKPK